MHLIVFLNDDHIHLLMKEIIHYIMNLMKEEEGKKEASVIKMRQQREENGARMRALRNTHQLYDIVFMQFMHSLFVTRH